MYSRVTPDHILDSILKTTFAPPMSFTEAQNTVRSLGPNNSNKYLIFKDNDNYFLAFRHKELPDSISIEPLSLRIEYLLMDDAFHQALYQGYDLRLLINNWLTRDYGQLIQTDFSKIIEPFYLPLAVPSRQNPSQEDNEIYRDYSDRYNDYLCAILPSNQYYLRPSSSMPGKQILTYRENGQREPTRIVLDTTQLPEFLNMLNRRGYEPFAKEEALNKLGTSTQDVGSFRDQETVYIGHMLKAYLNSSGLLPPCMQSAKVARGAMNRLEWKNKLEDLADNLTSISANYRLDRSDPINVTYNDKDQTYEISIYPRVVGQRAVGEAQAVTFKVPLAEMKELIKNPQQQMLIAAEMFEQQVKSKNAQSQDQQTSSNYSTSALQNTTTTHYSDALSGSSTDNTNATTRNNANNNNNSDIFMSRSRAREVVNNTPKQEGNRNASPPRARKNSDATSDLNNNNARQQQRQSSPKNQFTSFVSSLFSVSAQKKSTPKRELPTQRHDNINKKP